MTTIELTLVAIGLILILILINQKKLTNLISALFVKNENKIDKIIKLFKRAYNIFKKARRFSVVYVFKRNFSKVYLVVAVTIVVIKILLYSNAQLTQNLPIGVSKLVDFLIVSSAWEIACIATKIIEAKISKK